MKEPAFSFVIDELRDSKLGPRIIVKPMFGAHAVYVDNKIHFILRKREDKDTVRDDGVWVVVSGIERASVLKEFPKLRPIELFVKMSKKAEPTWLNLPHTVSSFEDDILRLVELVIKGDERLGKIPKSKLPKNKKAKVKKVVKIKKKKNV